MAARDPRSVSLFLVFLLGSVGCHAPAEPSWLPPPESEFDVQDVFDAYSSDAGATEQDDPPLGAAADAGPIAPRAELPPLEITYLGVGGFVVRWRGEAVLTAPLFSNPGMTDVVVGSVQSQPDEIDRYLSDDAVDDARALLVGHGHYDHLLDVPHVWSKTPNATVYGNVSTRRMLAAFAPDREDRCDEPLPDGAPTMPRESVVALNDPAADVVDYRMCPEQDKCFSARGAAAGEWVHVPNSNIRVLALCNSHAPQFGPVHFGDGCVDEDACVPPESAVGFKEGETLAFLFDFLDEEGEPAFRVYYQDAPADAPTGHVPPDVLAEKAVDVALLCVGTYDQVEAHPTAIIEALAPRFVLAGHWEDFFRSPDRPLRPIPFMDVEPFALALQDALPPQDDVQRAFLPSPGELYSFPAEPVVVP